MSGEPQANEPDGNKTGDDQSPAAPPGDGKKPGDAQSSEALTLGKLLGESTSAASHAAREERQDWKSDPPTPWNTTFEKIERPAGRETPALHPVLAEWRRHAKTVNAVLITGDDRETTQWAAECFSESWKLWKDQRRGEGKIINASFRHLIKRDLLGQGEIFGLVAGYWDPLECLDLPGYLEQLSETLPEFSGRQFGLVLWTRATTFDDRLKRIPPCIRVFHLEPSVESPPPFALDEQAFRGLFGHGLTSLREIRGLREKAIERTLVRIAVLFGNLPEIDLELLLTAALGQKTLHLDPATPGSPAEALVDLWSEGKAYFLRQAGMVRGVDDQPAHIGFPTEKIRAAAATAAWSDTPGMIEVLSALDEMTILFADDLPRLRSELYRGYISATVELARRVPSLYGDRWLESICHQYLRWVTRQAPDIAAEKYDSLTALLAAIANHADQRHRLWQRFAQRMGLLCRYLCADSPSVVETLFARLAQNNLHSLLWMILRELMDTRIDFSKWLSRLLREDLDTGQLALEQLSQRLTANPAEEVALGRFLLRNLPPANVRPADPAEQAAVTLPARILALWVAQSDPTAISLAAFLARPCPDSPDRTIGDLWTTCFLSPWFDESMRAESDAGKEMPSHLALAIALHQLFTCAKPDGLASVRPIVDRVRTADPGRWLTLTQHWESLKALLERRLHNLPLGDPQESERKHLLAMIDTCQQLRSL